MHIDALARRDTCRRLALCRAERGGLSVLDTVIVDRGRKLPDHLVLATFHLIRDGLLAVVERGGTMPRVELTECGRVELTRLVAEHRERMRR